MNFIGKIAVVLQLIASILFMTLAGAVYSTHTNWRATAEKLKKDLATEKTNSGQLTGQMEQAKREAAEALDKEKKAREVAEFKMTGMQQEFEATKQRVVIGEQQVAVMRQQQEIATEEAEARRQETLQQREINKQLLDSRNAVVKEKLATEDALKEAQVEKRNAELKNQQLIKEVGALHTVLLKNGISTDTADLAADVKIPPRVEGEIEASEPAKSPGGSELLIVSLGHDDQLRKGHELVVYRSAAAGGSPKYLGKITIIKTYPDKSVAVVTERAGNGSFQKGDHVTSKL